VLKGLGFACLLALCPTTAVGQDQSDFPYPANEAERDRFRLFTQCSPIFTSSLIDDTDDELDLSTDSVERAVNSRIRSARLYAFDSISSGEGGGSGLLRVAVHVVGRAFSVDAEFRKSLFDSVSGYNFVATTWSIRNTGTHGGDASYVLDIVRRHLDEFIDEYLRVNAEHCG